MEAEFPTGNVVSAEDFFGLDGDEEFSPLPSPAGRRRRIGLAQPTSANRDPDHNDEDEDQSEEDSEADGAEEEDSRLEVKDEPSGESDDMPSSVRDKRLTSSRQSTPEEFIEEDTELSPQSPADSGRQSPVHSARQSHADSGQQSPEGVIEEDPDLGRQSPAESGRRSPEDLGWQSPAEDSRRSSPADHNGRPSLDEAAHSPSPTHGDLALASQGSKARQPAAASQRSPSRRAAPPAHRSPAQQSSTPAERSPVREPTSKAQRSPGKSSDVQPSPGKTSDVQRSPAERATLDAHQSPDKAVVLWPSDRGYIAANKSLQRAVASGDKTAVKNALEAGADPNYAPGGEGSPMAFAAFFGQTKICLLLLAAGAVLLPEHECVEAALANGYTELADLLRPHVRRPPPASEPVKRKKSVAFSNAEPMPRSTSISTLPPLAPSPSVRSSSFPPPKVAPWVAPTQASITHLDIHHESPLNRIDRIAAGNAAERRQEQIALEKARERARRAAERKQAKTVAEEQRQKLEPRGPETREEAIRRRREELEEAKLEKFRHKVEKTAARHEVERQMEQRKKTQLEQLRQRTTVLKPKGKQDAPRVESRQPVRKALQRTEAQTSLPGSELEHDLSDAQKSIAIDPYTEAGSVMTPAPAPAPIQGSRSNRQTLPQLTTSRSIASFLPEERSVASFLPDERTVESFLPPAEYGYGYGEMPPPKEYGYGENPPQRGNGYGENPPQRGNGYGGPPKAQPRISQRRGLHRHRRPSLLARMAAENKSSIMQELRRVQSETALTEEALHSSIQERQTALARINTLGLKWTLVTEEELKKPYTRKPFDCPMLSEALARGKVEFNREEFERFGAHGLKWDSRVQIDELWFRPDVVSEAQAPAPLKVGRRSTGMVFTTKN